MNIFKNPFYLLGATPRDNRQKIMELSNEKSLMQDSDVCTQARLILTNPRKRIAAEISWFPGINEKKVNEVIKSLQSGNIKIDSDMIISLVRSPLIGFNVFSTLLSITPIVKTKCSNVLYLQSIISTMANCFEKINAEQLMKVLNEERSLAGIPEITDLSAIDDELQSHKEFGIKQTQETLKIVSRKQMTQIMLALVEEAKKSTQHLSFIDTIIDTIYVPEVQKELQEWEESIKNKSVIINKLLNKKTYAKLTLTASVDEFISELKTFDEIMQPIQVSMQQRGMEHDSSRGVAYEARGVALDLANIANEIGLSEKVMRAVKELFSEIGSVDERASKDLSDLQNIKEQDKQHEKDITCKIEQNGLWINHSFEISPKGIKIDGELICKLEDINAIRYGITRKSTNGIYSGTDTLLAFSTSEHETTIAWLDHTSNWTKASDCLWKAVGVRLILAMANELARGGNIYEIIYDNKVKLAKNNTWTPAEERFFKWSEVKTMIIQGQFVIAAKDGSGFMATLSLQDIDNVHVVEALISVFFKTGGPSISQAFGITKEMAKKEKRIKLSTPISLTSYSFLWSWFWVVFIGFILIVWAVNS